MTIKNAMLLAAGLGTRMRPLTETMPKPLIKVADKALIDYALAHLYKAGVERVVVNIHHHASQMLDHLAAYQKAYPKAFNGATPFEIIISDEREALLNSGGGLAKGLKLLPQGPVLVMNADLFWMGEQPDRLDNLTRLSQFFDPARMDMAMLTVPLARTTGHNGKVDFYAARDGRLSRADQNNPAKNSNGVVYAGALALQSQFLADAPPDAFNLNLYFDRAIQAQRLYGLALEGHWLTVGTPEAIGEAEAVIAAYSQEQD